MNFKVGDIVNFSYILLREHIEVKGICKIIELTKDDDYLKGAIYRSRVLNCTLDGKIGTIIRFKESELSEIK